MAPTGARPSARLIDRAQPATDELGPTADNTISHNDSLDNAYDCGITIAGHHVGGLMSLSEIVAVAPAYSPCTGGCGGAGGAGVPVQPGQTSFTVTITATYELLP